MQAITQLNFETELINASLAQPVLLDIWAPWCGPCKTLGPTLEKTEIDYAGRFKLVKLNADEEPEIAQQLSQMFGVRSIPFCVLFKGGQPVDGFVGALPEAEVKSFLDKHVASPDPQDATPDDAEEADALLAEANPAMAIDKLQAALATNPANDTARYDYMLALLKAGRVAEARAAYDPVAAHPALDARLAAAGHWLTAMEAAPRARSPQVLAAAIAADKRDFEARFELAQLHFSQSEFTQAMDELLEILMRDKQWHDGIARKTYVAVLQTLANATAGSPQGANSDKPEFQLELSLPRSVPVGSVLNSYRRKLSMLLF